MWLSRGEQLWRRLLQSMEERQCFRQITRAEEEEETEGEEETEEETEEEEEAADFDME